MLTKKYWTPCFSPSRAGRVVLEIETRTTPSSARRELIVVFPVPEGADVTKRRPPPGERVLGDSSGMQAGLYHKIRKLAIIAEINGYNNGMKINLLRCLVAMGDNNMQVSAAARELRMLQPSVSKNLIELEKVMGPMFVRRGRRFISMTPLGRETLAEARDILVKCDNLNSLRRRHNAGGGDIRIGTTHVQARYILPVTVQRYMSEFSEANIQIFQNTPANLAKMLENNQVDLMICTESMDHHPRLHSVDAYWWNRSVIMPRDHPLASGKAPITLKKLAGWPLVTYVRGFTGRASCDAAFRRAAIKTNITVAAADSDIIKTYVRMGIGVGIIAAISYEPEADKDLEFKPAGHIFPDMCTRIAHLKDKMLTDGMTRFITIFCEHTEELKERLGASK